MNSKTKYNVTIRYQWWVRRYNRLNDKLEKLEREAKDDVTRNVWRSYGYRLKRWEDGQDVRMDAVEALMETDAYDAMLEDRSPVPEWLRS